MRRATFDDAMVECISILFLVVILPDWLSRQCKVLQSAHTVCVYLPHNSKRIAPTGAVRLGI